MTVVLTYGGIEIDAPDIVYVDHLDASGTEGDWPTFHGPELIDPKAELPAVHAWRFAVPCANCFPAIRGQNPRPPGGSHFAVPPRVTGRNTHSAHPHGVEKQ